MKLKIKITILLIAFNFAIFGVNANALLARRYVSKAYVVRDSTFLRKGFYLSFGLGMSNTVRNFSAPFPYGNSSEGYSDSKLGVSSEIKVGYAISQNFILYYRARSIFSNDYHFGNGYSELFLTALFGVGGSYFFEKKTPSLYTNTSLGYGISKFAPGNGTSSNTGFAFGAGLGLQLIKQLSLELNFDYMNLKPNEYSQIPEHKRTSIGLTLQYNFFIH